MICVGIDPGLKGGVCVFVANTPSVIPMPIDGNGEIFSKFLHDYLLGFGSIDIIAIEEAASRPEQGVVSMFTFGKGYGKILAICEIIGAPIIIVKPQRWKNIVLPATLKDKAAAIAYCKHHYPDLNLILPGTKRNHDGMADSVCIARYAQKYLQAKQISV